MKKYGKRVLFTIILITAMSCGKDDSDPVQVEERETVQQEEEELFSDTESIDWFFYHNTTPRDKHEIQSVMTSRDSTKILELYSDPENNIEYLLSKTKDSANIGVFEIRDNLPETYYISNMGLDQSPLLSFGFKEDFIELYYHNYDIDRTIIVSRFNMVDADGDIQFIEYTGNAKSMGVSSKQLNECSIDIQQYSGEEQCIVLARQFWCKNWDWKAKMPVFLSGVGLRTITRRREVASMLAKRAVDSYDILMNLAEDELENRIAELFDQYFNDTDKIFAQSLTSFIYDGLYKGQVNGFCRSYGYELDENNYLINIRPAIPKEVVSFDTNSEFIGSLLLEKSSKDTIVAWPSEEFSESFSVVLKLKDSTDNLSGIRAPIVWRIEDDNRSFGENLEFSDILLNEEKTYNPKTPDSPGLYKVEAYLANDPDVIQEFVLQVKTEEEENIFNILVNKARWVFTDSRECTGTREYVYRDRPDLNRLTPDRRCLFNSFPAFFRLNGEFEYIYLNDPLVTSNFQVIGNKVYIDYFRLQGRNHPSDGTYTYSSQEIHIVLEYIEADGTFIGEGNLVTISSIRDGSSVTTNTHSSSFRMV